MNWDRLIADLPGAHVLQTWEWGQIKSQYGWTPILSIWRTDEDRFTVIRGKPYSDVDLIQNQQFRGDNPTACAAALVLCRMNSIGKFEIPLRVLYVPKGPLVNWKDPVMREHVLDDLRELAVRQGAIFIKIDPDVILGTGFPEQPEAQEDLDGRAVQDDLRQRGWCFSREQVQFRNTLQIDLTPPEDVLLERMKQKTRYNIHLAQRKGVTVRVGTQADLGLLYRMYAETSLRDGFVIRGEDYYQRVWSTFLKAGLAEPLIAEVNSEAVAALVTFRFAGKAWFLYGMSRVIHREKMPNHLLQWEAMRRAKKAGCIVYDLWGAPDEYKEDDRMWGVYRFKEGLGGQVVRMLGAWDLPVRPRLYRLYTQTLPRLLAIMRRRGITRTQQALEN